MKTPTPRALRRLALLAGLAFIPGVQAAVLDDFDYTLFTEQTYWSRINTTGDNAFVSPVGTAVLRGRDDANAHSAIISSVTDTRFNFFTTGFSVGVEDIVLTSANLDLSQAFFRLSLSSTNVRQFTADDAITMRFRYNSDGLGGLMLFGYKMNQASTDAEVRIGTSASSQSLESVNFTGTLQSAGFTFAPVSFDGTIATVSYTVSFTTTAATYSESGTMLIDQAQWGNGSSFAALALEARRNNAVAGTGNSDARVTFDTVTYTAIPEPAAAAALAGATLLGLALTRRRPS